MTNRFSYIIGTCALVIMSSSVTANATATLECVAADAPCSKTDGINHNSKKTFDLKCVDSEGHDYAPTSQSYYTDSEEVSCYDKNKTSDYYKYLCINNSDQRKREVTFDINC